MRNIGDRIGAIMGSEGHVIEFLGYGRYDGLHIPMEAVGILAEGCRSHQIPNPRLVLDNGKVVYGCECWFGSEAEIKESIEAYQKANYEIKMVDIDEIRKELLAEEVEEVEESNNGENDQ